MKLQARHSSLKESTQHLIHGNYPKELGEKGRSLLAKKLKGIRSKGFGRSIKSTYKTIGKIMGKRKNK
jgi:hypothetical protein